MPSRIRRRNHPGEGTRLRKEIVDATERLLATSRTASTITLRGVAAESGITAPAIYAHFDGMSDLLSVVVESRFTRFGEVLDAAASAATAPRDRLRERCLAYCRFGLEHPGHYLLMFGSGDAHLGVQYDRSAGAGEFQALVRAVRDTLDAGTPTPPTRGGDERASDLAAVLWPALHGLVLARGEL
ncbi:MAG: hypothetical protein RI885_2034, partial [Actinomycetota bacterium]